tara:strand:+ start:190 stop:498 length:309 start_codon:yes stop_codon:yes gene_type:complete
LFDQYKKGSFMRKKVIIGAMFGGVVLLLWQFAVHELLGIYDDAFVKLKDPAAVEAVLKENLTGSGMFVIPHPEPGATDAEAKVMDKCGACCGSDGADATPDA